MQILLIVVAILSTVTSSINPCHTYLTDLATLYVTDKAKFAREVHGFILYSGKTVNDLGLPDSCIKYPSYRYFTGQARGESQDSKAQYRAYLGLCFSSKCTAEDINNNFDLIIDTLLNLNVTTNATMVFMQPTFTVQSTSNSIVFMVFFGLIIAISMKETLFNFFKNCRKETKKEEEELHGKYAIQLGEDYDPTLLVIQENQGFFKKFCLVSKMHEYFTAEQSTKIGSFSVIRILAVPLAFFGYLFYLCNIASFNYSGLFDQIYEQRFSKIAVAAYYIPDILFFISGFLLARKAFTLIEVEPRAGKAVFRLFLNKLARWVPLYWAFIVIYWQISPALHAGPIWHDYQNDAAVCNTAWWRTLFFIDNWFQNGCYNFAWFIPAEIQLSLVNIIIMLIYLHNKKVGFGLLIFLFLLTWILTLTLSAPFPSSLNSTLSHDSQGYFKSTYSHMPYYLLGIINAYLACNEKTKETLQKLTRNKCFRITGVILGYCLIILIIARPSIWQGQLRFQLGLAKTGMFIAIYLLIFWSIFSGKSNNSVLHRIATLSKGVLLIGGIVVASAFYGGYTLPYLDRSYLLNSTVTNLVIAIPVGSIILALLSQRPRKEEQNIL